MVEGVSDLIYLTTLSGLLIEQGRTGLAQDIVIVPVGGMDKVASFVSLIRGNKLNIICLLDYFSDAKGKQRLDDLIKQKIIAEKNILYFGNYKANSRDLEDLFEKSEYLDLFNSAFDKQYTPITISSLFDINNPILPQINTILKVNHFNHYLPAEMLLRRPDKTTFLSSDTLARFEKIFIDINKLHKK